MRSLKLSPPGTVLAILCGMYFLYFVDRTNFAIAGPVMQADLGLSNTDLGILFAAFGIPYALLQPLGGAVGDRLGPRLTLGLCAVIVCVATAWVGAATGMVSLFAARLLLGIGEGSGFPTATRAMSAWTPRGRWGFAQGITHTFSRVGNAATSLIVVGLIAVSSWRVSFFVLGAATLIWVVIWLWYFRDDPRSHPSLTPEIAARLAPSARAARPAIPWLALARHIAPVTMVDFCYGWFLVVFQTWIPSYFMQNYGLNLGQDRTLFDRGAVRRSDRGHVRRHSQRYPAAPDPECRAGQTGRHYPGISGRVRFHDPCRAYGGSDHGDHLSGARFLFCRIDCRAHLGGTDGYRTGLCRYGERDDEFRLRARQHRVSHVLRLHDRADPQLDACLQRLHRIAAFGRGTRIPPSPGQAVPGGGLSPFSSPVFGAFGNSA